MFEKEEIQKQVMIAESPDVTPALLAELSLSSSADVREAVADNRLCPLDVLIRLSEDESVEVRYALAENHNLDMNILEKLTRDENPYVAMRAERTLRRILLDNVVSLNPLGEDEKYRRAL